MSKFTMSTNAANKNAQKYFTKMEQSGTLAKKIRKEERAADAAKTVRLRGLRLAKEAADKAAAEKLALETGEPQTIATGLARPAASQRKRATVRMFY